MHWVPIKVLCCFPWADPMMVLMVRMRSWTGTIILKEANFWVRTGGISPIPRFLIDVWLFLYSHFIQRPCVLRFLFIAWLGLPFTLEWSNYIALIRVNPVDIYLSTNL